MDDTERDCKRSIHTLQNKKCKYSDNFERILTDNFPEENYKPKTKDDDRTTVHYGQRKLFLSEVEFLTNCMTELPANNFKPIVVIYAGAAPGIHINFLSEMFPFIEFDLIDPAKFLLDESSMIKTRREFFDDRMALDLKEEYQDYVRLFISDIRRYGPGMNMNDTQIEKEVLEDMNVQMNWYGLLEPFRSLFKFRPPNVENRENAKTEIEYLKGDVYFQIWAPSSSSETRLFVRDKAEKVKYDCKKYENQLFRFNNNERVMCYKHEIDVEGLDHCYDCRAEIHVFENYLKNFDSIRNQKTKKKRKPNSDLEKLAVDEYVNKLNRHLNAQQKNVILTYQGQEYSVKFTDIRYNVSLDKIFNKKNLIFGKTLFGNKWKAEKTWRNDAKIGHDQIKKLKDRLDFSNKHLHNKIYHSAKNSKNQEMQRQTEQKSTHEKKIRSDISEHEPSKKENPGN